MRIIYSGVGFADRLRINKVLKVAMAYLAQPTSVEVSVSMVDSDTIHYLNNRDRQVDRPTDVLSYPYLEITAGDKIDTTSDTDSYNGRIMLGDIIICRTVAVAQATQFGHSVTREVCYLAVHSLLHLLGYDHTTPQEEQQMTVLADSIMNKAGINR